LQQNNIQHALVDRTFTLTYTKSPLIV
jgi:hypothetical protein